MCDPTGGVATAALLFGGAAYSAVSQYQAGKDAQTVANQNARIADEQAQDSRRRGQIEEDRQRDRVRLLLGSQRAAMGANNVVSSTGTPLSLLEETAQYGELDALTIRNNAAREAYGYQVDAEGSRARGRLARREATTGAISTLIGGAGQAVGAYYSLGGTFGRGKVRGGTRIDASARPPSSRGYA